jgi:hypothetical protein
MPDHIDRLKMPQSAVDALARAVPDDVVRDIVRATTIAHSCQRRRSLGWLIGRSSGSRRAADAVSLCSVWSQNSGVGSPTRTPPE